MKHDQSRRRISRECEQWFFEVRITLHRDSSERRRFARLDFDATEVDGAVQSSFDDGFEKVARAHGGAACGDDHVGTVQALLDDLDMGFNSVSSDGDGKSAYTKRRCN